ncbi:aminotransferase A [Halalkalibacillus halophilus]|uniref:aminotransferase A n=1 Tax=Halalkalibacillus halophilus TaxID=392827 RepID=UPI000417E47A|nr:aminotransferase A [Halalkalibacillus halophilus]
MEHLINNHVKDIEISGIRKFFNLVNNYEDVVSLTIGQPDFHTPNHVKNAAIQALESNHTTYTPNAGLPQLRTAIHHYTKEKYNLNYEPDTEIIVTVGASQAIDITLRTIITPGDEVILPAPVYPGYEPLIRLAGGIPVHIDTTETDFKLTAHQLKRHITEQTKCVILPYPSNPTGVSLTQEELSDLADIVHEHKLFVLADEIYSELTYENKHSSIGLFEKIKAQTLIIQGVSKSHSMTGFRIGYVLGDISIIKHMLKVHQYNVSCATSISQYAALEALTVGKNDSQKMRDAYLERRNYVINRLNAMGVDVVKPDGAFYVFPKLSLDGVSSFQLGLKLVKDAGLALVPGDAFSTYGEGYMRLSYAYSIEILEKGLDRLESFLQNNKQSTNV